MVVDKRSARMGFARRLGEALASAGVPDNQARRGWVSRKFGVSVESARKWLVGESMPDTARIEGIAGELGVSAHWLLMGGEPLKDSSGVRDDNLVDYIPSWQADPENVELWQALDRAYRKGSLTPAIAHGITAMVNRISEEIERGR